MSAVKCMFSIFEPDVGQLVMLYRTFERGEPNAFGDAKLKLEARRTAFKLLSEGIFVAQFVLSQAGSNDLSPRQPTY